MPKMTGMRFVAEAIRGYGVTHVFYVPQMLLETLVEMEGWGIKRVMTHGEKAAAYMADGYARAALKPGVCMAQHVGGSNLAAGLKDAYLACSPVIALTGGPAPLAHALRLGAPHALRLASISHTQPPEPRSPSSLRRPVFPQSRLHSPSAGPRRIHRRRRSSAPRQSA